MKPSEQLPILTIFLSLTAILAMTTCSNKTAKHLLTESGISDTSISKRTDSFKKTKEKYKTLYPIFEGLFITHNEKKWGVIDSSGKSIVPFICDGIKSVSDTDGIFSQFSGSYSLNTGVPRYVYCGKYFYFTKNGIKELDGKDFSITIVFKADFHNNSYILQSPYEYLPKDTTSARPCSPFNPFHSLDTIK